MNPEVPNKERLSRFDDLLHDVPADVVVGLPVNPPG
jgi:hypothetical protein